MTSPVFQEQPIAPGERVFLPGINFSNVIEAGDSFSAGDVTITVKDSAEVDKTTDVFVAGTIVVTNNVVGFDVNGVLDGEDYEIEVQVDTSLNRDLRGYILLPCRTRQTSAASTLISVDEALLRLGLGSESFTRIEWAVRAASTRIEEWCNTYFAKRINLTVLLDGNETAYLRMPAPILSIASVTIDGVLDAPANYTALLPDGLIYRMAGWYTTGIRGISVVGTFGYDPVPADVKDACFMLLDYWTRNPVGAALASEQIGEYSYKTRGPSEGFARFGATDIPTEVQSILLRYRRWSF